jgi:hypothetical protein
MYNAASIPDFEGWGLILKIRTYISSQAREIRGCGLALHFGSVEK